MTTAPIHRWQRDAERYDQPHLRLRQVGAIINQIKPKRMLDVGCGRGQLAKLCTDTEYTGCDFVTPEAPIQFPFHQLDVNAPTLPDLRSTFNLVTCSGMLEYVKDLPRFFHWMYRHLAPDGQLIATYFNFNHLSRRTARALHRPKSKHPDWANELQLTQLTTRITDAGFVVERTIPTHHALSHSPGVEATVHMPTQLPTWRPWSPLLAHQFILVARTSAETTELA